jgi:pimeloyl-ACP methyl ester carboxylesterase
MDRTSQTIKLKDGRTLGFAEYGDPKGNPIFYFHGWPASRFNAAIYDSLTKKLHIRMIAPDRPGFGLSDYKKNRTLLDFPDDIQELADYLNIKKFATMGVSGGGPYAVVCAYKIPKWLTKTGIVVGLGQIRGPESVEGLLWMGKLGWLNYGKHPWIRRGAAVMQYFNVRYGIFLGLSRFAWGKADRKLLADPEMDKRITETIREAFHHGYEGPELDLKLYSTDWGFDLKDIRSKVYLWYGEKDQNASPEMGKYYAKMIPKSNLKTFPNEGHLISVTHAEEILKTLTT